MDQLLVRRLNSRHFMSLSSPTGATLTHLCHPRLGLQALLTQGQRKCQERTACLLIVTKRGTIVGSPESDGCSVNRLVYPGIQTGAEGAARIGKGRGCMRNEPTRKKNYAWAGI